MRTTLTEEQVQKETERCLECGVTVVDQYLCLGCGQCVTQCKFDAISLVRKYDETSVEFEKLKPVIVKNVIKRKGRILTHSIKKSLTIPKK